MKWKSRWPSTNYPSLSVCLSAIYRAVKDDDEEEEVQKDAFLLFLHCVYC